MSPLAVGLVCPYDLSRPGGVQAQVLGLAGYLQRQGDRALVLAPGLPEATFGIDLGSSVTVPANRSRVSIALDPRVGRRLRAAARGLDLIHVHEPLMPLASWSATKLPVPLVMTFHADPPLWARRLYRVSAGLLRRRLGPARAVTAVSPVAASALPPGLAAQVIPNGIDTVSFRPTGPKRPGLVVFLGRDEPRKGLDLLVEAWEEVSSRHPRAELVVAGARRRHPGITWMGRVDEEQKRRVLGSASIFVAPHLGGESFGIVVAEAMAAGCAVVASDLEAFRHVAGATARYFPPGESRALAGELSHLLADADEAARLGEEGLEAARRYDWDRVGDCYRLLYQSALS